MEETPIDALNGFIEQVDRRNWRSLDVAREVLEGKDHLTVTFKQEPIVPVRMESPARAHRFWSVEGFTQYLQKYATADLVVLGDVDRALIAAVLNEQAEGGFEVVTFSPLMHPFWKPWAVLLDKLVPLPIRDFAKFVVAQRHVIAEPDPETLALTLAQVRVSKKVEMQTGFGVQSINGIMVETSIQGQKAQMEPVALPTRITLDCPMFIQRPNVRIEIDLIVDLEGDKVVVDLVSGDAEAKAIAAFTEMIDEMRAALPDAKVALGRVEHEDWRYINRDPEE